MRFRAALIAGLLTVAPAIAEPIDPAAVTHADFRRVATGDWAGLAVHRHTVADDGVTWKLWRITNPARPDGPLWVVPHDNENAAFAAAIHAVRRWGGTIVAVDSGTDDTVRAARYVTAWDGSRLDPNRTFTAAFPAYVGAVLSTLGSRDRPIIALHTNAPGFDPAASTCGTESGPGGGGAISIKLCNATYTPRPAADRSWPWDDDDSIVIAPYLASAGPGSGWCQQSLVRGNFNISFEKVAVSDGSLSNYAAQNGLSYLNFETQDRGNDPAGLAEARDRLTAMVDAAMTRCLPPETRLLAAGGSGKEAR